MILVAGVSASGKTHTIASLRQEIPTLTVISGSSLLLEAGWRVRPLSQDDALKNQWRLLDEMRNRGLIGLTRAVFDGHATIEAKGGAINVPDEWYDEVDFAGFVHIEAKPEDIAERREARGLPWSLNEVMEYQEDERCAVRHQAKRLRRPFLSAQSGDASHISAWAEAIFSKNPTARTDD